MKTNVVMAIASFVTTVLLTGVITGFITGCSNAKIAAQKFLDPNRSNTGTSADNSNQAPKISCSMQNMSNPAAGTRMISTILSEDTFFADQPVEGNTLSFDCNGTDDESSVDELTFELSTNYDIANPTFVPVEADFTLPVASPGRRTMALRVSDGDKVTIKTFTVVVECLQQIQPSLNLDGVNVTASSRLNYFNYSIDPGAVSSGNSFQFSWDFNGDYGYDPISMANPNEMWTSAYALNNIYTIFATEQQQGRKVGLKVRNDCQLESYYVVDVLFPMDNIPRTPAALAEPRGYWYLQYDVSSAPPDNQRRNGDVLHTWYADDPVKRVECDYKKARIASPAVFTIRGFNWYKNPAGQNKIDPNNSFMHGMKMTINNINDNLSVGTQSFSDANVELAQYYVSNADDSSYVQEIYEKNAGCTVHLTLVRATGVTPCAEDQRTTYDFEEDEAFQIYGEFSCPNLRNSSNQVSVRADDGKFFCEVAPVNQCVGGGQGGGGDPPPEQ